MHTTTAARERHVRASLDALRRIVRALRLSSTEVERSLGVSLAQLFVLQRLADGRPRSLVELAAETLTDPSSVSVVARRLVTRRLVVRRADPDDARRAQLSLTASGRALLARAPQPMQDRLVDALTALSDRRVAELARTLDGLAQQLGVGEAGLFFEDESKPRG
jgi:DNA-binding MarR family transcriptional regulator